MKLSDVKEKAYRLYNSKEFFRSFLENENLFPLVMSLPKVSSAELRLHFSEHRNQIQKLVSDCQKTDLELKFKTVNHRTLGPQEIPHEVLFSSLDIFLKFISKEKEFNIFKTVTESFRHEFLPFTQFAKKHPEKILEYDEITWTKLINVCSFFIKNSHLNLYIRQLDIPGVDTKFIENNKRILSELLNIILPKNGLINPISELSVDFFEERYGLRKEEPRLRFRLLDSSLRDYFFNFEDIELTVAELIRTEIPCSTVIIIENKITGLCIPDYKNSVVIFELGYKAGLLKKIQWLQNRRIIYWGDIDTHGFAILSRLRSYFPHVESRLMNRQTLQKYVPLWTLELSPFTGECPHLTPEEQDLFQDLKWNRLGKGVRLEQERIPISDFENDISF